MNKQIKVGFKHVKYFWKPVQRLQDYFLGMSYLIKKFNIVISKNPDFIFTNIKIPKGNYTRIHLNHENVRPSLDCAEWVFGVDYEDHVNSPRYMREPNYVRLGAGKDLIDVKRGINKNILDSKTKFCAFVYSVHSKPREQFFELLSKYKRVDAPGGINNNMLPIGNHKTIRQSRMSRTFGEEKIKFLQDYKFVIAFENASYPGYCSEKLYHPMLVNSIPIYWGNPLIGRDFNLNSFINPYKEHILHKQQLEYMVEKVIELDKDDTKYYNMLSQPWYPNNQVNKWARRERIIRRYRKIFAGKL